MRSILLFIFIQSFASPAFSQEKTLEAFSKSYAHENAKAFGEAIKALDQVYDAASYPINLRLGWLHYLNGDNGKSKGFYQKAIKLQPGSVEARLGYVLPLAAAGEWGEVVKVYKKTLETDPSNSLVHYRLALIYFNNKDFETAVAHAQKVTSLHPFDYDGQLLLGKIEVGRGNIVEAKRAFLVCLQYSPSSKEALELWERVKG